MGPCRVPHVRPTQDPLANICAGSEGVEVRGRYWDRTSDLFRVREARYRCANRPGVKHPCVARWRRDLNPCRRLCRPLPRLSATPPQEACGLEPQSGQPGSNRRPQPWQGCALPTELCPHTTAPLPVRRHGRLSQPLRPHQIEHSQPALDSGGSWGGRCLRSSSGKVTGLSGLRCMG